MLCSFCDVIKTHSNYKECISPECFLNKAEPDCSVYPLKRQIQGLLRTFQALFQIQRSNMAQFQTWIRVNQWLNTACLMLAFLLVCCYLTCMIQPQSLMHACDCPVSQSKWCMWQGQWEALPPWYNLCKTNFYSCMKYISSGTFNVFFPPQQLSRPWFNDVQGPIGTVCLILRDGQRLENGHVERMTIFGA